MPFVCKASLITYQNHITNDVEDIVDRKCCVLSGPPCINNIGMMFRYNIVFLLISVQVEKKYLDVGQGVMIIHSKEMATIKYVGHTDFAPGIWIGLELRNPKGSI